MDMRFCFIGVGSIARRHIRNLCAVLSEEGVTPRIRTSSALRALITNE